MHIKLTPEINISYKSTSEIYFEHQKSILIDLEDTCNICRYLQNNNQVTFSCHYFKNFKSDLIKKKI